MLKTFKLRALVYFWLSRQACPLMTFTAAKQINERWEVVRGTPQGGRCKRAWRWACGKLATWVQDGCEASGFSVTVALNEKGKPPVKATTSFNFN